MIIVMKPGATNAQISNVIARIEQRGCRVHVSEGHAGATVGVIGDAQRLDRQQIERMDGVERTSPIRRPFKLASREFHPPDTIVPVNGVSVGSQQWIIMAGPCAVESRDQLLETAHAVKEAGAHVLRGGAFKPRSSPYSFQGLGEEGLRILAQARQETGLPVVTEVMDTQTVPLVAAYADILQIGARNMQNFALLNAVGEAQKPVLLKRGMMSTVEELLMAAEYILSHGNQRVMVCERGIRTYEPSTRNTFDINAIPLLKSLTHLPVIADPSHGTGNWELVTPVARAAMAAGADGLIIEVHPNPAQALSDGAQSLKPDKFARLVAEVRCIAQAVGRMV